MATLIASPHTHEQLAVTRNDFGVFSPVPCVPFLLPSLPSLSPLSPPRSAPQIQLMDLESAVSYPNVEEQHLQPVDTISGL